MTLSALAILLLLSRPAHADSAVILQASAVAGEGPAAAVSVFIEVAWPQKDDDEASPPPPDDD